MMEFTFVFQGRNGVLALTGKCPDGSTEAVFRGVKADAERQAGGPVTLLRTCFSVPGRSAAA
jgi:hypothetical protein